MAVKYAVLDMQCFRREEREVRDRDIEVVRLKSWRNLQLWRTSKITWTSIMWGSIGDDMETLVEVSLDQWLSVWAIGGLRQVSEGHRTMTKNLGCHSNFLGHQNLTAWIIKTESKVNFSTVFPAAQKSCLLCKPKQGLRMRQGIM